MRAAGIERIDLAYQAVGRRDEGGNFSRYRGTVHLTNGKRLTLWDVFLKLQQPVSAPDPVPESAAPTVVPQAWPDRVYGDLPPQAGVNRGRTPMMIAASLGHLAVVAALLDLGADAHVRNERGESALDLTREAPNAIEDIRRYLTKATSPPAPVR